MCALQNFALLLGHASHAPQPNSQSHHPFNTPNTAPTSSHLPPPSDLSNSQHRFHASTPQPPPTTASPYSTSDVDVSDRTTEEIPTESDSTGPFGLAARPKGSLAWVVIPGTPGFTVDGFEAVVGAAAMDCRSWFLTHFHADRYKGLSKGEAQ